MSISARMAGSGGCCSEGALESRERNRLVMCTRIGGWGRCNSDKPMSQGMGSIVGRSSRHAKPLRLYVDSTPVTYFSGK